MNWSCAASTAMWLWDGRGKVQAEVNPETLPATHRMGAKLASPEGRACYAKRKWLSEAPNGWIKEVLGFRRFSLRGVGEGAGRVGLGVPGLEHQAAAGPGSVLRGRTGGIFQGLSMKNRDDGERNADESPLVSVSNSPCRSPMISELRLQAVILNLPSVSLTRSRRQLFLRRRLLVTFDNGAFPQGGGLGGVWEEIEVALKSALPHWRAHIKKRIGVEKLTAFDIHFICLPMARADDFRKAFLGLLGVARVKLDSLQDWIVSAEGLGHAITELRTWERAARVPRCCRARTFAWGGRGIRTGGAFSWPRAC